MALKVGITGGIGSGKTTVCKIFETLGIPVYNADNRAKWLMANDPHIKGELIDAFGEATFDAKGVLQRQHLSNIVFKNAKKLELLNGIVHPAVARDGAVWQEKNQSSPYTIKEAALLFEAGSYRHLDKIIMVYAPKEVRLNRVVQRDKTTKEAVLHRMNNQMDDLKKVHLSDYVIFNDGKHPLIPQIIRLDRKLKKKIDG